MECLNYLFILFSKGQMDKKNLFVKKNKNQGNHRHHHYLDHLEDGLKLKW